MNSPISNSIFNNFNSYNDYLLSKNICLFLQKEYGIEEISQSSLLLLTKVVSNFIEKLSHSIKNCTELAGREESNIIDILFTLLLKSNKNQNNILSYVEKKLSQQNNINNYNINEYINIKKLNEEEEKKRNNYLEELNCIHVPQSNCINKTLLNVIPKNLRYFPREFTLKYSENILEKNDETIKEKNEIKKLEKKNLEGIISGNGYYDINQKNKNDKGYINLLNIYNDIVKELGHNLSQNDDNNIRTNSELFGQKFFFNRFLDDHKDNEIENKGIGDNNISNININNNNDNDLGHVLYDNVKI
jgi:hypothetical protein